MIQVWSCGGGVQSAAVAVLIIQGRLPKPDFAIIVDTEREKETTWTYYDSILRPELAKVGVDLVRVPKSKYATVDLYPTAGKPLIPAFTLPEGRLETYCSNEWKRRVIMRYCRRELNIERCQNWLGISTDELNRVRTGPPAWFQPRYPLIFDVPKSRAACIELVRIMGWPPPPRSSCWMCPHQSDAEWRDLTDGDRQRALDFEREIQQRDAGLFLHRSCQPLSMVEFDTLANTEGNSCQTGFCFT